MAEQAPLVSLAVGEHVRLRARESNQLHAYQPDTLVAPRREPVDGLVLSIREIASGRLVKLATGNLDQFVIELLYDRTFHPRYASLHNAPRGTDRPTATRGWRQMRAVLRDAAEKGQLFSTTTPEFASNAAFAKLVDGWKVIKVWSRDLESLEHPVESTDESATE